MKLCTEYFLRAPDNKLLAVADVTNYYDSGAYLNMIRVLAEHRGRGHGTQLLKKILAAADHFGEALYLEIKSFGGLSYDDLEAWYRRHGFTRWRGIYRRLPKGNR